MEWQDLPVQALFALEKLEQAGFEAALVGGCVRDRLMGRTPGDYDIATSALPEETLRVFAGERTVPTGLQHGTVMLVYEGMPMEITTFREDGEYTDMRRPDSVRFTRSLKEDVRRRDFTMNALAWEREKGVIDHTGGAEDINNGLIRAVGVPERRFSEDALRILRAVRFSAQLGFKVEKETEQAAFALQENIGRIAAERVRAEMEKTLRGRFAAQMIGKYRDILRPRLLCAGEIGNEQWALAAERLGKLPCADAALSWAALLAVVGAQRAQETLQALRMDKATAQSACRCIALADDALDTLHALRCAAGDMGMDCARNAVRLKFAFDAGKRQEMLALLGRIESEKLPCTAAEMDIGGADLMETGLRGREVGRMMALLLDDVRAGRIPNRREALLARAGEISAKG